MTSRYDYEQPARVYELKVAGRREPVRWSGQSGEHAARRYVDAHREAVVNAWRHDRSPQIRVGCGQVFQ